MSWLAAALLMVAPAEASQLPPELIRVAEIEMRATCPVPPVVRPLDLNGDADPDFVVVCLTGGSRLFLSGNGWREASEVEADVIAGAVDDCQARSGAFTAYGAMRTGRLDPAAFVCTTPK